MNPKPHIVVVGAGIIGSAMALELATRGASVTLVDAGGLRASENSFGWINASWFNQPDYFRLRHFSMAGLAAMAGQGVRPGAALVRRVAVGDRG